MYCLKCGKNTQQRQVFCQECLQVMEQYPVAPGTTIQLPQRESAQGTKKTPAKPHKTQSEIILQMRSTIRWLSVTLGILVVLLGVVAGMLVYQLYADAHQPPIGRNYTTVETGAADVSRGTWGR